MYACTRLALHENLSSVTKDVGADDSARPLDAVLFSEIQGESVCTSPTCL